jgi:hypothetical protein
VHPAFESSDEVAYDVSVDERGVHVVGYHMDWSDEPTGLPAYWLNGALTLLQTNVAAGWLGIANNVTAGNGHVYATGFVPHPVTEVNEPRFWVDGATTDLDGAEDVT